jgi:hypothetical protein
MKQKPSLFVARMGGEDFAAKLAEVLKPWAEVRGELLVDFAAQALGNGGAFAGGGDGDLEIAATDDGAEEEIAVGDVIDAVGEDAATHRFAINEGVYFGHIGGGDYQRVGVEVGRLKGALDPFKFAFAGELLDFGACGWRHDAELEAGCEKRSKLFKRDVASAYQEATAAIEFEEDR